MKFRTNILPKTVIDYILFMFIVFILTLGFSLEVLLVLPSVHPVGSNTYYAHLAAGTFIMANVAGNFIYMLITDTGVHSEGGVRTTAPSPLWHFCTLCNSFTPPRASHCGTCRTCILKRDHHCNLVGYCIGHGNHRYFYFYLTYLAVGLTYAFYLNSHYFLINKNKYIYLSPIFLFIKPEPLKVDLMSSPYTITRHWYIVVYYCLNIFGMKLAVFQWLCHSYLIASGRVMREKYHSIRDYDFGSAKENVVQVLGQKWYLTWISPIIPSPLPSDGFSWEKNMGKRLN